MQRTLYALVLMIGLLTATVPAATVSADIPWIECHDDCDDLVCDDDCPGGELADKILWDTTGTCPLGLDNLIGGYCI